MTQRNLIEQQNLPDGWAKVPFGDAITLKRGFDLPKQDRQPGDIPIYAANGCVGTHNTAKVNGPGVVTGRSGTIGKVSFIEEDFWPLNTTLFVEDFHGNDPKFSSYLIRYTDLRQFSSSTAVPTLNRNIVHQHPIALPPLNEQRRIVAKIEELKAHTLRSQQALDEIPALIDQFRQSVLAAAFRGDLTADWRKKNPNVQNSETYLREIEIKPELPPDFLKLHPIPHGWSWASLGSISKISGGLTKNSKRKEFPLEYPYLRVANVYANKLDLDEVKTINIQDKELERVLLEKGDLLVVEGNGSIDQIGRVALWDGSINPCLHQNHLIKVRFDPIQLGSWVLPWLLSEQGRRYITRVASSTSGLHTLSLSKVSALPIPIAPRKEQEEILKKVNTLFTNLPEIEKLFTSSNEELDQLNQAILAKAFRGELVPQDPNDEPASVLLDRIRVEREKLGTTKTKKRSSRKRTQ